MSGMFRGHHGRWLSEPGVSRFAAIWCRVCGWLIEVVNGNPLVTPWQSEKMWRLDQRLRKQLIARSHQITDD